VTAYRARTIKRERRSRDRLEQLDAQILAVLRDDHPQSVRHLFYRMTDPRLPEPVEKSERGYRHVQDRCVKLRRARRLPYGWIVDATRRGYFVQTFGDSSEFLRRVAGMYRADLWRDSDFYAEVWVESRSIAGVVQGLCRDLAVPLYPAGGFSSITLAYEAAQGINAVHRGREAVVFYVGDFDPAGVLIDEAIERELRTHLDSDVVLDFRRIAITEEQIERYDLPRKPRKLTDRRALHVTDTVEAEAMPAATLRSLLRTEIEALLPEHALKVAKVAEESERKGLLEIATLLGGRKP
jgi:hypothetical protein